MPWKLLKSSVRKATPALCRKFIEMKAVPFERRLSDKRLKVYEQIVRNHEFRPVIWSEVICLETGEVYRVNGQHTANLFLGLCDEFDYLSVVHEEYECESVEDVGRLYGTIDCNAGIRSSSDVYRTIAAGLPELAELPRKVIDAAVTGMAFYHSGGAEGSSYSKQTPQQRAEGILDRPEFAIWIHETFGEPSKFKHLYRRGVAAGAFGSWLKAKKDATEFWTAVRDETGPAPTSADRALAKWLLLTSVCNRESTPRLISRQKDSKTFFAACLQCWNAWRRGDPVKSIKYNRENKLPPFA